MAVFTIAGLTLKEAARRRTFLGSFLLGLFVLGLTVLLALIRRNMFQSVETGQRTMTEFAMEYDIARSAILLLCLAAIKVLGGLFALMLAGGAVSSEIERGLLAVILPKPIHRWQILLGKWIGMNLLLGGSVLLWTAMAWASLTWQTGKNLTPMLVGGLYLTLIPVVVSALTLTLSTVAQRLLGTSLAIALCGFAWLDGVFDGLGVHFRVEFLRKLANGASLVVPQGTISWWVERATESIVYENPFPDRFFSPQFPASWGAHLDAVYVGAYVLVLFALGAALFHRRDV